MTSKYFGATPASPLLCFLGPGALLALAPLFVASCGESSVLTCVICSGAHGCVWLQAGLPTALTESGLFIVLTGQRQVKRWRNLLIFSIREK